MHSTKQNIIGMNSFQGGIQTQQHPNPGQPYYAFDFPRIAYLPASDKGRKVSQLLYHV